MRLKRYYTSREVAGLTGLTARQLQWWDARRLFVPAVGPHRTAAGGFTERRYTPVDVLELQVLADLRRRGLTVTRLRRYLAALRDVFGIRLYEAIGQDGVLTLFMSGADVYARTSDGRLFNLDRPTEPLLMVGEAQALKLVAPREPKRRPKGTRAAASELETPSRGRRRDAE